MSSSMGQEIVRFVLAGVVDAAVGFAISVPLSSRLGLTLTWNFSPSNKLFVFNTG